MQQQQQHMPPPPLPLQAHPASPQARVQAAPNPKRGSDPLVDDKLRDIRRNARTTGQRAQSLDLTSFTTASGHDSLSRGPKSSLPATTMPSTNVDGVQQEVKHVSNVLSNMAL
jgi:hypothetical protein